jgi:methyl coenzyme M reductase beta subunit
MCTRDWAVGEALNFSGSLVTSVPSGTALTITAVPFTVILDNDVQEFQTGLGGISTLQVDFREVW